MLGWQKEVPGSIPILGTFFLSLHLCAGLTNGKSLVRILLGATSTFFANFFSHSNPVYC